MTKVSDIVLIYYEETPHIFARIEDINPDVKPGWSHVKLLLLLSPLQVVTWILRDTYIDGAPFTMGGKNMRLEKIVCPEAPVEMKQEEKPALTNESQKAQVISFSDLKKTRKE